MTQEDPGSSMSTCDDNDVDENEGRPIFVVLRVLGAETVLKYVPLRDLVRSESVCKGWQRTVHWYLEKYCPVHCYYPMSGDTIVYDEDYWFIGLSEDNPNNIKKLEKLRSCIKRVILMNRCPEQLLKTIATKCLSLQSVEMHVDELRMIEYFFKLIESKIVSSVTINLDTTRDSHDDQSLLTAIQNLAYLGNVTSLNITFYPIQLLKSIHLLFLVTPKLQSLSLRSKRYEDFALNEFIGSISRLSELKRLTLYDGGVSDALLEALAQGCSKLQCLEIGGYALDPVGKGRLTPKGLGALCSRSPSAVTTLHFSYFDELDRINIRHVKLKKPLCQELEALCCVKLTMQHFDAALQAGGHRGWIRLELKSSFNAVDAQDPRQELKIILSEVLVHLLDF